MWAWSSNPSKIPRKVLLTVTNPDQEIADNDNFVQHSDPPQDIKGAYDYKLHLHLDVVEGLAFLHGRGGGGGGRPIGSHAGSSCGTTMSRTRWESDAAGSTTTTTPAATTALAETGTITTTTPSTMAHDITAASPPGGGQHVAMARWKTATAPGVTGQATRTTAIETSPRRLLTSRR
ncbi:hypothetical protein SETIT_1G165400v2 [Setaria italica]|uniref:Uncharacterized protein n=1 Tax=Setaria italica TaxID=4555 RepID=A0A368PLV0_SETIT|nr:hypothetical protein SETIT_1G165400v2 [Setaria italica]